MILDALIGPLLDALSAGLGLLPEGKALDLPNLDGFWNVVAGVDSIVPILGPLVVMMSILSMVLVFMAVRVVLTVWNLVWP